MSRSRLRWTLAALAGLLAVGAVAGLLAVLAGARSAKRDWWLGDR